MVTTEEGWKPKKLAELARQEGYDDALSMIDDFALESVVPGICRTVTCDYTTQVEPDQQAGYCEICHDQSVWSCLRLAGVL